jgi:hypothetical protein
VVETGTPPETLTGELLRVVGFADRLASVTSDEDLDEPQATTSTTTSDAAAPAKARFATTTSPFPALNALLLTM